MLWFWKKKLNCDCCEYGRMKWNFFQRKKYNLLVSYQYHVPCTTPYILVMYVRLFLWLLVHSRYYCLFRWQRDIKIFYYFNNLLLFHTCLQGKCIHKKCRNGRPWRAIIFVFISSVVERSFTSIIFIYTSKHIYLEY